MARLDIQQAEGIAQRGRPWTFRLEYVGANSTNASGVSSKYWYATGRGIYEPVEIGYGAIGARPANSLIDWTELKVRVQDKIQKGYVFVDTPFIRMSPANLAVVTGNPVQAAQVAVAVSSAAPPPPKPAPRPVTPPPAPAAPAAPGAPSPGLVAMGQPYSLIQSLRIRRQGTTLLGYEALDAAGNHLLDLDAATGVSLARDYNLDINF